MDFGWLLAVFLVGLALLLALLFAVLLALLPALVFGLLLVAGVVGLLRRPLGDSFGLGPIGDWRGGF